MTLFPTRIDFETIRVQRQDTNDDQMFDDIMNKKYKYILTKRETQLIREVRTHNRHCNEELTLESFLLKCSQEPSLASSVARNISKCASRQGTRDEKEQISVCSNIASQCGIQITQLSPDDERPLEDGTLWKKGDVKSKQNKKYKSYDATIEGKLSGKLSAKVCVGTGGHQDNVVSENKDLIEWYKKHGNANAVLVILFDASHQKYIDELKEQANGYPNIIVMDHHEFQEYLIQNYYMES